MTCAVCSVTLDIGFRVQSRDGTACRDRRRMGLEVELRVRVKVEFALGGGIALDRFAGSLGSYSGAPAVMVCIVVRIRKV